MARLLSAPVLGGGALFASPALWGALVEGTMRLETAFVRFTVGVLVVWVGISLLLALLDTTSAPPVSDPASGPAPGASEAEPAELDAAGRPAPRAAQPPRR